MRQVAAGLALWTAGFRSTLQYRTDTFIVIVMALAFQCTGFAFIWVLLSRFPSLAGWTLGEVAFLYGLRLIVHALAGVLTGPIFSLEDQVRSGEFDRYLLRPVSPLLQFMTQRVEISILGDLLGGVAIFAVANQAVSISWTPVALLYLLLAIIGGALIEGSVRILIGSLTFRTLSSQSLLFLTDSVFSSYASFPMTIFGTVAQYVFTFILPIAFVAFLPTTVLLDKTGDLAVNPVFAYAAPLIGLGWAIVAARVFNRELSQYQSAGH
jgi:ABC-2 type transport system permease protein